MKRLGKFLILIFALCALCTVFTACKSNSLPAPIGISLDEDNNLTWAAVENARSYKIEITDVTTEKLTEKSTNKTKYSLDNLAEGSYEIRIKAVSGFKEFSDSEWSEVREFKKGYSTGCLYKLIKNNTEYQIEKAGRAEGVVYIEDKYRGKPVTSIARLAFRSCSRIEQVVIGPNVKEIGENAFMNCKKLVAVTIPESVETIGKSAFQSCAALEEVTIPYGVTQILDSTFAYCKALKKVNFSENVSLIEHAAFSDCVSLEAVTVPDKVKELGEYAFSNCGITEVTLGINLETIGNFAFYKCINLTDINFNKENKVKRIGESAFANCIALEDVNLPEGVEDVDKNAFYSCEKLGSVTLPESLSHLGLYAFNETELYREAMVETNLRYSYLYIGNWLAAISEPMRNYLTNITPYSRRDSVLNDVQTVEYVAADDYVYLVKTKTSEGILFTVKEDAKGIADGVFSGAEELKKVYLPSSVKYIGNNAFYGAKKLWSFEVPDNGLLAIGDYAFCNCSTLETPTLGNRLKTIGSYAFYNCKKLNNSTTGDSFLPETLERIGTYAFRNTGIWERPDATTNLIYAGDWVVGFNQNVLLSTVSLPSNVRGIADYAFYEAYSLTGITGLSNVTHIGRGAFYECFSLSIVTLNRNLTRIEDYTFYECSALTISNTDIYGNTILPSELVYIGRSAFYGCNSLLSVNLRTTQVTEIGDYAFYYCQRLSDVQFNDQIVYIGEKAFYNDGKLKAINLPDSVETIGEKAFYKCEEVKELNIGNGVNTIGDYAFCGLSELQEITIPDSVVTVGNYAFYNCTSVTDLTIGNSVEEIGNYAFYGMEKLKYLHIPASVNRIGNYAFKGLTSIRSFILSGMVEDVGMHAFYGAKNATIYSDAPNEPSDWNSRWNSSFRPAVWGCVLSEDGKYVVSVQITDSTFTNTYVYYDEKINNVFTGPRREGYIFVGWATEQGGDAVYAADEIVGVEKGTVLYSVWEEGEEPEPVIPEPAAEETSSTDDSSANQ